MHPKHLQTIIDSTTVHLQPLIGRTIKGLCVDTSDTGIGPCFGLRMDNGFIAWVMCDPEGNGPGHLIIDPPESDAARPK